MGTDTTKSATVVREAMTTSPHAIEQTSNVVEAARLMASEDVGSLPVVESGRLVGIVTDRDLVVRVLAGARDPETTSISEVCSENPAVAQSDESLVDALTRMASEQVRRLPVVDGDQLVGVLAQADVARSAEFEATGRMVEKISED
jgi:CBS domain-containing protein